MFLFLCYSRLLLQLIFFVHTKKDFSLSIKLLLHVLLSLNLDFINIIIITIVLLLIVLNFFPALLSG